MFNSSGKGPGAPGRIALHHREAKRDGRKVKKWRRRKSNQQQSLEQTAKGVVNTLIGKESAPYFGRILKRVRLGVEWETMCGNRGDESNTILQQPICSEKNVNRQQNAGIGWLKLSHTRICSISTRNIFTQ